MNCATHNDIAAVAFCRTCGKPLCGSCTRDVRGVIYCEPCLAARLEGTAPAGGFVPPQTSYQQTVYPPVGAPGAGPRPSGSGPNPAVAGILAGFFPVGVGAVYCSQYAKGLAYLVIMVLLGWGTDHTGGIGGFFVAGVIFFWVFQIIDAVRTARAIQEGQPAPDPMGIGQAFGGGERIDTSKVPVGAVILIGLGVLFLLHTMGILEHGFDRFWPIILILLGGWMFARQCGMVGVHPVGCTCDRCRLRKIAGHRSCPCDRCRMRRIMGPAMMVTIGTLLLLQSLDVANFDRTWPAILLVVGVVKLLQSNASSAGHVGLFPPAPNPAAPPPPPPPSSDPGATSASGEVRNV
jgi:Domain of unknown function (DUF5668)/B-box zinc finger